MVTSGRLQVWFLVGAVMLFAGCRESTRAPVKSDVTGGEALFLQHCAMCHPDGGNVFYPHKSLQKGVLAANGITTPEGIVARMRNPGPRMKRFDKSELDDREAGKIAAYILEAFR